METIYRYTRHADPFMWFAWCMAVVWGLAYNAMPQTNFKLLFAYWLFGLFILEVAHTYLKPLKYVFPEDFKFTTFNYIALFLCPRVASLGTGVLSVSVSISIQMLAKNPEKLFFVGFINLLVAEVIFYIASFQYEIVRQSYLSRVRYVLILLVFGVSLFFQKI